MEKFENIRKIIRESLEQVSQADQVNTDAAATLMAERIETIDKQSKLNELKEERRRLLEQLQLKGGKKMT